MVILLPFAPNRAKKRLESVAGATGYGENAAQADWTETITSSLDRSRSSRSPPKDGKNRSLRMRFMHAGYRGNACCLYFGAKTLLALLFPAIAYLYVTIGGVKLGTEGMLAVLLGAGALGYYLPNVVLSRLVFVRKREIFENSSHAADPMLVCVESGLGLDADEEKVTEEMRLKSIPLAEELHLVNSNCVRAARGRRHCAIWH